MNRSRLTRLLKIGVEAIQANGPDDWMDSVSEALEHEEVNAMEMLWLSPRLAGYAHGVAWGFDKGANTLVEVFALGHDDMDARRN